MDHNIFVMALQSAKTKSYGATRFAFQHTGPPTHPGEMILEEFLKPLGMTQTEFAQRIGVAWARANQIINGKCAVTTHTALRLEKLFDMPADFWLTLQLRLDLHYAMRAPGAKASP